MLERTQRFGRSCLELHQMILDRHFLAGIRDHHALLDIIPRFVLVQEQADLRHREDEKLFGRYRAGEYRRRCVVRKQQLVEVRIGTLAVFHQCEKIARNVDGLEDRGWKARRDFGCEGKGNFGMVFELPVPLYHPVNVKIRDKHEFLALVVGGKEYLRSRLELLEFFRHHRLGVVDIFDEVGRVLQIMFGVFLKVFAKFGDTDCGRIQFAGI